ncbi:MAG TPA: ABC transporter permease, partial [Chitinophagaceae bacterium]|nr:ABC transporter permease [Chitinophagaceae bacterium]
MLRNFLKSAWRNLYRNKQQSFINILGLSAGMAVSLLIGSWIYGEVSFDRYHKNYDRIAQVMQSQLVNSEVRTEVRLPIPLGEKLKTTYGDNFDKVVLSTRSENHILAFGENKIITSGRYMQSEAPAMFTLNMLQGSAGGLKEPASIMLSQTTAKMVFGTINPMDKLITFDNDTTLKVTGVYEDLPANTTLNNLSFMVPWELMPQLKQNTQNWTNNGWHAFVQLAGNADMQTVSSKIKDSKYNSVGEADKQAKPVVFLHPMSKWHLYSEFKNGVNTGGEIRYVRLFAVIGAVVLLLACINFMNLSTARSEKRAREVGVRKAIGSLKQQLIYQFLVESVLVAFLAFLFSIILIATLIPFLNQLANERIEIPWAGFNFWAIGLGFTLVTGLLAGSYPAFYLSSFRPVSVLKGAFKTSALALVPRKILVVLQFAASTILIIGTIVVYRQIKFAHNRAVGYNKEGLMNVKMLTPDISQHFEAFRTDLLTTGAVEEVALSSMPVTESTNQQRGFHWQSANSGDSNQVFATIGISKEYGSAVGWQFTQGRDFRSGADGADAMGFVVNESAVKMMGLKDPIGAPVRWGENNFQVIGVVKDMVMQSPFDPVLQTVFYIAPWRIDFLNIRIKPTVSTANAIQQIEKTFRRYNPNQPFDYKFADDEYARKFDIEQRVGKLSGFFSILAILISSMGIFGMATFVVERRVREIGVRKVLGANVLSLWRLLSGEFVILVTISLLVAMPLGYMLMQRWLTHYTYRT